MAARNISDHNQISEENLMSVWSTLSADAQAAINALEADVKALGAMIYNDVVIGAQAAEASVVTSLPAIALELKAYAKTCVAALEANPALKNALGSWKFGIAASQVLQAVEGGILPGLVPIVKTLAAATIETAVQDAFAAMVVCLCSLCMRNTGIKLGFRSDSTPANAPEASNASDLTVGQWGTLLKSRIRFKITSIDGDDITIKYQNSRQCWTGKKGDLLQVAKMDTMNG
jgi:hypothetical protein